MRSRVRPRPVGVVLAIALAAAGLGIAGTPPTPVSASCAEIPLIPSITEGDSLFIGTVVSEPPGIAVRIDRWLVGPVRTGTIAMMGRASLDPDAWSSVDWEPQMGTAYVIAARPDERGVLHTDLCRVSPLTPEAFVAVEEAWPSASPEPVPSGQPVSSSAEDETFRLTITTPRSTYTSTEAIPVSAILQLKRTEPTTTAGSGSGPVVFGVEQLDGPIHAGPAMTMDCARDHWAPNEIRVLPFTKSGGFDASDPMAPFWTNYFNDPALVLPAGHYRVFALVDYDLDDCSAAETTLTAEVRFEVVDPAASASPEAG